MANSTNITRDSNAELLRLICMFFIVFHHILVHGAYPELLQGGAAIATTNAKIALLLNGLFYPAVNIFILISGYFGINFSIKKLFNLYIFCGFYGMLGFLSRMLFLDEPFSRAFFTSTFLPFTHNPYWFINCYIALFFLAPILNKFIREATKRDYIISLILLTFLNLYIGYFWARGDNPDGYSTMQFIYVYFIGGFIKRFVIVSKLKEYRWHLFSAYLLSALCWTAMSLLQSYRVPFEYNNPFIITGAIGLFGFVMTFNIKSKPINWLASSALAVYLIQSAPATGAFLYPKMKLLSDSYGGVSFLIFAALALAITLACCLFDKIRILLMKPVWMIYEKIEPKINKVQKSFMDTV